MARRPVVGRRGAGLAARRRHAPRRADRVGRLGAAPALDVRAHGRRPAPVALDQCRRAASRSRARAGARRHWKRTTTSRWAGSASTTTATGATASRPTATGSCATSTTRSSRSSRSARSARSCIRPRGGGKSRDISPASGDLLVMGGRTQVGWEHGVPKVKTAGPRISVTWRWSSEKGPVDRT